MTEHERYLFDLQGYLVIPNALSTQELDALNGALDAKIEEQVSPDAKNHRFIYLLPWGAPFRRLIDNPRVSPYLDELVGANFRLDHEYLDIIRPQESAVKGPVGTWLHGGGTPFDHSQFYRFDNGTMHNGLVVAAYNLHDVGENDGGFGAIPGSHKSNYPFPNDWHEIYQSMPSCVQRVTGKAGTAVVFTEALTHGTLPWVGAHERRTAFYKFSPKAISWSAHYYRSEDYDDLTEREVAILEAPNARYKNRQTYRNI